MNKPRRILFVTGSRGEWGYIRPLLRILKERDDIEASIVATNMHLLSEFGSSIDEIKKDGVRVDESIYMALDGYTDVSMAKSLGVFLMSITDTLGRMRPDFILLAGDRGEQLMAAIAGAHLNIPVAHIQAGEVSGNIDGVTRHAIARYSHLHFASNEDAANRLLRSGEQEFRIFTVGAPQLDDFLQEDFAGSQEIADRFHLNLNEPVILVAQHPVTEQLAEAGAQIQATLNALDELQYQTVLIYPNNDAGSEVFRQKITSFRRPWLRVERNVARHLYAGLMRIAAVLVGNSSSGIIEAPSFELPAVNIGRRQIGRMQGKNVLGAEHNIDSILKAIRTALTPDFKRSVAGMKNPYGDGYASKRIIDIFSKVTVDEKLIFKSLTY